MSYFKKIIYQIFIPITFTIFIYSCKVKDIDFKKNKVISISKITSDNGDDTLYVETILKSDHENLISFEKQYTNLYYYSKLRNVKLLVNKTEYKIEEIVSVFKADSELSIICLLNGGLLEFRNYKFEDRETCNEPNRWCLNYKSSVNMNGESGIKKVVWIESLIMYLEPICSNRPKIVNALIGRSLRIVAKDSETINNNYFDFNEPMYKNEFSTYFSNKSWYGTFCYKLEYEEGFRDAIEKKEKNN